MAAEIRIKQRFSENLRLEKLHRRHWESAVFGQALLNHVDRLLHFRDGLRVFLDLCAEPAYRRLVIEDGPAVLGPRRCREIENDSAIGMMVAAMKELKRAGTIKVSNAELAARMLASMVCEAALLLADAVKPAEFKRDAIVIVNRTLDALSSDGP